MLDLGNVRVCADCLSFLDCAHIMDVAELRYFGAHQTLRKVFLNKNKRSFNYLLKYVATLAFNTR